MRIRRTAAVLTCAAVMAACGSNGTPGVGAGTTHPGATSGGGGGTTQAPSATTGGNAGGGTSTAPAGNGPTTTINTVTTTPAAPAPTNLRHATTDAPSDDGVWAVAFALRGRPLVWSTHYRPFADRPDILAAMAVIDQTHLHAALFNGPVMPGGGPWKNGRFVAGPALPALVAAFNGGFEMQHMFNGGYKTEGVTVKALKDGHATIAIKADGTIKIGQYGVDFTDDGTWLSFRQNLPPVVLHGQPYTYTHSQNVWGTNYGGVLVTNRSAICNRKDGRLMFAYVPSVNVINLGKALVTMGCTFAMELDINGTWPQFATYEGFGTSQRIGDVIDSRMTNPNRYVTKSSKDFIAFFDPQTLPAGALAS